MHFARPRHFFSPGYWPLYGFFYSGSRISAPAQRCGTVNGKTHVPYLSRFLLSVMTRNSFLSKEIDL
jgi:hypothetical protein